jgi:hypothetical protein
VGARFFAHVQTGPETHPASCTMGTWSFPGVKRPGRGADHPPSSSAEVKKEYSYTSTPPLGLRVCYGYLYHYLNIRQIARYFHFNMISHPLNSYSLSFPQCMAIRYYSFIWLTETKTSNSQCSVQWLWPYRLAVQFCGVQAKLLHIYSHIAFGI